MKKQNLIRSLIIITSIIILWNTFLIEPLKTFTVFLHELSHFFSAKLVGFDVEEFQIFSNNSGFVSYFGNDNSIFKSIFVGSAGYLGSLIFAAVILSLRYSKYKRYVLISISCLFLYVSIFYSGFSYTLLFSIMISIFIVIVIKLNKPLLETSVIEITGFASILYALSDTFVDTILYFFLYGSNIRSDAVILAERTGVPSIIWGVLWSFLAMLITYYTIKKEVFSNDPSTSS